MKGEEIKLDLSEDQQGEFIPVSEITTQKSKKTVKKTADNTEQPVLINCLRKEIVTVRFVRRMKGLVQDSRHVLAGGMAETAVRVLTIPQLRNGSLKSVLTDAEKDYLEAAMGLEPNALSLYLKNDNYWTNYRIRLGKADSYLDLSVPEDYIKYKVLLANDSIVAPNLTELNERPKATYEFVLISEEEEVNTLTQNMSTSMEASLKLGTILENKEVLKYVIEAMEGKPISPDSKLEYLKAQAFKVMESDPKRFLSILKDPILESKVFIKNCVSKGLIRKRDDFYYLAGTNAPLCQANEDPTLNVAAKFINKPVNQELKLTLEAKLKSLKE